VCDRLKLAGKKLSGRGIALIFAALVSLPALSLSAAPAAAETRSLKLYYIHTKEKAVITFKRNGKYDQKGLQELNRFLRDWRRNQPTKMDPRLFDLVWEVYQRSGAKEYINVVSAFRSPETNGMLRSRTKGVAKNSQHTLGKAMDFYIPGVKLSRLREIAMQMQIGGVGFYPTSGSPFVHLDVGSVRAWPRMSRQDLVRIFPKGNTIHLPADGKPLPGYDQAMADYKRRVSSSSIQVASTAGAGPTSSSSGGKKRTLLSALFGGGDEDEDADSITAPAPEERPAPVVQAQQPVAVASAEPPPGVNIDAPLPLSRPSLNNQQANTGLATALYSPTRNAAQEALQAALPPTPTPATEQFADLGDYKIPVPTLLGPRGMRGDAQAGVLTAAVDPQAAGTSDVMAPIPANRPAVAEALLAAADADVEAQADAADQKEAVLSPIVVAALERSGQSARDSMQHVSTPVPTAPAREDSIADLIQNHPAQTPAPAQAPKKQVASLAPATAARETKPTAAQFGDAFDVRGTVDNGLRAGLPAKGGRPSKQEAAISQEAMSGGGRLTQDLISGWALNKTKGEAPRNVKAPRVVSNRILNNEMTASNTPSGFKQGAGTIDSSRFSTPVRMP
jgi:uncharacterized protein YcbK (DUF882 family)